MVNLAASLTHVEERVERFFSSNNPRMVEMREDLIAQLVNIGRVVIIGGVVRDLAFFGASSRPISDIDFVVTGSPLKLELLAKRLGAVPNRFGGFGLTRGGYKVDFWSISKTWAKTQKHVMIRNPKDLVKTTFFDWDAIIYDMTDRKVFAIDQYLDRLHRRVLEINLLQNPSIEGNVVRALRRIVMWDAKPGRRLASFLSEHMNHLDWRRVIELEDGAFHTQYLKQFHSSLDFKAKVLYRTTRYTAGVDARRQLDFDFL